MSCKKNGGSDKIDGNRIFLDGKGEFPKAETPPLIDWGGVSAFFYQLWQNSLNHSPITYLQEVFHEPKES